MLSRRELLQTGSLAAFDLRAVGEINASRILLWLSGGLAHLDTFDMKPDAPPEIRGEFNPIRTNVSGIQICEHLPRTARHADKFTIIRSMCSTEINHAQAARQFAGIRSQGVKVGVGTGPRALARACSHARSLVERGTRSVVVSTRYLQYDTHAGNFKALSALLPELDLAYSSLIEDLHQRGLLDSTLVIMMGEFGRSPRINEAGGRDHHSKAWSIVLAGGGFPGGRIIGATDKTGTEVTDTPVTPSDLLLVLSEPR
jgi:hypothetical protein